MGTEEGFPSSVMQRRSPRFSQIRCLHIRQRSPSSPPYRPRISSSLISPSLLTSSALYCRVCVCSSALASSSPSPFRPLIPASCLTRSFRQVGRSFTSPPPRVSSTFSSFSRRERPLSSSATSLGRISRGNTGRRLLYCCSSLSCPETVFSQSSPCFKRWLLLSSFCSLRSFSCAVPARRHLRHSARSIPLISHRNIRGGPSLPLSVRSSSLCSPITTSDPSYLLNPGNLHGHTHMPLSSLLSSSPPRSSFAGQFPFVIATCTPPSLFLSPSSTRQDFSFLFFDRRFSFPPHTCPGRLRFLDSCGPSRKFSSTNRESLSHDCEKEEDTRRFNRSRHSSSFSGGHPPLLPPRPPDPIDEVTAAPSSDSSHLDGIPSRHSSSSSLSNGSFPSFTSALSSPPSSNATPSFHTPAQPVLVLRAPTAADLSLSPLPLPSASSRSPPLTESTLKPFSSPSSFDSFPFLPASSQTNSSVQMPQFACSLSSGKKAIECMTTRRSFEDLGIHSVLRARLKQLGIENPTRTQTSAISLIDRGRDCVIVDRTGTGKTIGYLLPLLNKIYKMHDILLRAQLQGEEKRGGGGVSKVLYDREERKKMTGWRTNTEQGSLGSKRQGDEEGMKKEGKRSSLVVEDRGTKDSGEIDIGKSSEEKKRERQEKEGTDYQTKETRNYMGGQADQGRNRLSLLSVGTLHHMQSGNSGIDKNSCTSERKESRSFPVDKGTTHSLVKETSESVDAIRKEEENCVHLKSGNSLGSGVLAKEERRGRKRKPEAIGRILQKELFRRQEEWFYYQKQRHAALPPTPHAWEERLFRRHTETLRKQIQQLTCQGDLGETLQSVWKTGKDLSTSAQAIGQPAQTRQQGGGEDIDGETTEKERKSSGGGKNQEMKENGRSSQERSEKEEYYTKDAFQDALDSCLGLTPSSPNPLASLRPAILLLPTHDMVVDALHALRRLDVLGRVQVQCLSSVDKNIREKDDGTKRERQKELLQLKREMEELNRGGSEVAVTPSERTHEHHRANAASSKEEDGIDARKEHGVCHEHVARGQLSQRNTETNQDKARSLSAEECDGRHSSGTLYGCGRNDTDTSPFAVEALRKKQEGEDQHEILWMGQRVRRPRLISDDGTPTKIYTETRPFSEKKIKKFHELHLEGGVEEGGRMERERWGVLHERTGELTTSGSHEGVLGKDSMDVAVQKKKSRSRLDDMEYVKEKKDDGLQSDSVEVCRLPVIYRPRIRWGAVDLVITTPHLFLEDLHRFRGEQLYPSMLILDEVDDLLQARGSRTLLMDILGYCRPRVPVQVPHTPRTPAPDFRPCQVVFAGATLAALGPCSSGVMLIERFGTASEIHPAERHQLRDEVRQLWIRLNETRVDELLALSRPSWRSERVDMEEEEGELDEATHQQHTASSSGLTSLTEESDCLAGDHREGSAGYPERKRRRKRGMVTPRNLKGREVEILGGRYRVRRKGSSGDQEEPTDDSSSSSLFEHDQTRRRRRLQASWEHRVDTLLALLTTFNADRTVIFVSSVERCIRLFDFLRDRGWPAVAFHRKMSMKHRTLAVARLSMGQTEVGEEESDEEDLWEGQKSRKDSRLKPASLMVATDLACRGLDLQGVQHVINFDFPTDAVSYIHRAGRTCRGVDNAVTTSNQMGDGLPFPLVSNLLAGEDMPLASSLFQLQHQGAPLHSVFSRKASFKARYLREREAARQGEGEFSFLARKEDAARAAAEAWRGMMEAQRTKVANHSALSSTVAGGHRGTNEFSGSSPASRGRKAGWEEGRSGHGSEEDSSKVGHAVSSLSSPVQSMHWGEKRGGRKTMTERRRRGAGVRGQGQQPRVVEATEVFDGWADEDEEGSAGLQRRRRLINRLLKGAVWSADGRSACIEAPRSFYQGETEPDTRKGRRAEGCDDGDSDGASWDVNECEGRANGVTSGHGLGAGEERALPSMAYGAREVGSCRRKEDGKDDKEGTEKRGQQGIAASPQDKATPSSVSRTTNPALQMRAALFLDDDSDDEGPVVPAQGSPPSLRNRSRDSRSGKHPSEIGETVSSEIRSQSEVPEKKTRDASASERLSSCDLRRGWTREDYEAFVIRRFQSTDATHRNRRGIDVRQAQINQLQRRAQAMRTKMLMGNFGAGDDFEDEDLKI
ncbi:dead deah box helicase domain-containing protein [Cystoisospora suis]|uniref:ATP-dependent RNA helicase n=1 Tax=Cystoisospora suis TaxID=483139 RepID=A0A2C6LGT4_9APIC|nr:dead deah box helicase domain-containing protein [Cystoisospora suis]